MTREATAQAGEGSRKMRFFVYIKLIVACWHVAESSVASRLFVCLSVFFFFARVTVCLRVTKISLQRIDI